MPLGDFHLRASIAVSDIEQAVTFYEGQLGLQALYSGPSATIPDGSRVYGSGGGPGPERLPVGHRREVTGDTGDLVRRRHRSGR